MRVKAEILIGLTYAVLSHPQVFKRVGRSREAMVLTYVLSNPVHSHANRCHCEEICLLGYDAVQSVES
jgi:hypothetical protein